MKLMHLLLILSQVILVSLLAAEQIRCDTVFVLETADSDSSAPNGSQSGDSIKSSPDENGSNADIITDDSTNVKRVAANNGTAKSVTDHHSGDSKHQQNNHQRHQHQTATTSKTNSTESDDHRHVNKTDANHKQQPQTQHQTSKEKHQSDHNSHETHSSSHSHDVAQNDEAATARHRDSSASRRSLDSESQLVPARDKPVHATTNNQQPNHNNHPAPHHNDQAPHHHDHPPPHHTDHRDPPSQPHPTPHHNQKPKPSTTTTTTTTTNSYDQDQVPKSEERLLISITSDDDDSYQKPKLTGSSGEESSTHQQQPHHHQKRKPSFTISIQDPGSINKQNGQPAVILRPTEDGIVIATLSSGNNNNNKQKPSGGNGILSGLIGAVINQQQQQQQSSIGLSNNNNNNEPYREPINSPIRPVSTTRSPHISEPYGNSNSHNNNNNNDNQPITSTLVGGQRPQQPWTDERPQKPTYDEPANSETTRRPTSRPTFQQDVVTSSSSNQQQDYEGNGGGGSSSGGELVLEPKYPLNEKNCGIMHETRIVGGEEADPDDFMWMAAIIKSKPRDGEPRPFCGGSLITRRHILTAAHCLEGLAPRDVLVRLGGYDFDDTASSSSADFAIDQFRVPAQYSKKTHVADIAIMRLKTPLQPNDNYKTVCMPQPRRSYVGALGTVTGYGSQSQTFRRAAPKLRQVTVPIWENRKCSSVYKKNLTESFMCAGYEEGGKDACQGDSGGPLMTEGPEQKMMIVGVVSHGIGCGAPGYPGVYTRTSTFHDWIEKNTKE